MNALALALALAWGPPDVGEDRLPLSLSESYVPPAAARSKEDHEVLVGAHLGAADAVDGDGAAFLAGIEWRIHILPWLAAGASIDYQSKQHIDKIPGADFFQVPFIWSVLIYPPLDLGRLRPYGLAGAGFTVTSLSGPAVRNITDLNILCCLGFGAEFELGSNVMLDVNVRFVWAQDPPSTGDFSADWAQVTVGVLVKLPK